MRWSHWTSRIDEETTHLIGNLVAAAVMVELRGGRAQEVPWVDRVVYELRKMVGKLLGLWIRRKGA